jgi:hypothetical protein
MLLGQLSCGEEIRRSRLRLQFGRSGEKEVRRVLGGCWHCLAATNQDERIGRGKRTVFVYRQLTQMLAITSELPCGHGCARQLARCHAAIMHALRQMQVCCRLLLPPLMPRSAGVACAESPRERASEMCMHQYFCF